MNGIYQEAAKNTKKEHADQFTDRRLWTAVLLQALEDWASSNTRLRKEAEKFFFESSSDFATVCRGAGLEPSSVLSKLEGMKQAQRQPAIQFACAA